MEINLLPRNKLSLAWLKIQFLLTINLNSTSNVSLKKVLLNLLKTENDAISKHLLKHHHDFYNLEKIKTNSD